MKNNNNWLTFRWRHIGLKRIVLFFLLFSPLFLAASSLSVAQVFSFTIGEVPLSEALDQLSRQTSYRVLYNSEDVKGIWSVPVNMKDAELSKILNKCLGHSDLAFELKDKQIIIYKDEPQQQQQRRQINGVVKDGKTGEALPGVNVVAQRANKFLYGVSTDAYGRFKLNVESFADGLAVSMVGYEGKVIPLTEKESYVILLTSSIQEIDDVVVTGIFNKAKESFTGAATFIGKAELEQFESRNIIKTISNIDPSFNIVANDEYGSDPNKLPEINIRGISSVPSKTEQELEELQDDERVNLNTPLFILDGFEISLERMMDLNQEEIESITILKDASATAIYGARGANGVVVLTSVKPKAGKLKVSYRGSYELEVPDLRSYDLLNAAEKLELERLGGLYESDDFNTQLMLDVSYNKKLKTILEGTDTYWLSRPVQVGLGQNHNLSLSGGDPAFRYSLNFQYRNTVGAMKGSSRDNMNGSVNITYLLNKIQFTNILSIGFNNSEESQYGSFSQYATLNPYWRPYDENGDIPQQFGVGDPVMSPVYNPLYNASLGGFAKKKYTNIRENFMVEWTINPSLKISGSLGYSRNLGRGDTFLPPNNTAFISITDDDLRGSYSLTSNESSTMNAQTTINYAKVIDKHRIYIGVNGNIRESQSESLGIIVTGFPHDRMDFISMGSKYRGDSPSGREGTTRSVGVTANANYTLDNCYYADLSYRLDGASSFGEDSRFAPFYSIGVGWNINQMPYFKEKLPEISSLRLKYSYGVTGSLQFSPYEAMTTYTYMTSDIRYNGNLATSIKQIGNPDLKWQTTYQHNIGTTLGLWSNALSMNANFYYKRTEDLITSVSLPLSNGYAQYTENLGDVLNQGVEVDLSINILRNRKSSLGWTVTGGISHNRNKLLKLSESMKQISLANEYNNLGKTEPNYLYREGESMNALFVVPSLGIDPATGKEIFINEKGQVTYDYPQFNRVPHGLMQPKINGRFSSNWIYKDLRVNMGFSFRTGAHLYNSTLASMVEVTDLTRNVDKRVFEDRWREPGDYAKYKGLRNESPTYMTSRFVQKERTLSLNTLSVDYLVPREWVQKHLNMTRVSIGYVTNDLLYISTIKKERGTGYPYALRHSISLSFGF